MGTRALITINEKPFIATHWDGYPSSLGADLIGKITKPEIIGVAKEHSIDFATAKVCQKCNKTRFAEIAERTKGTKKEYTAKEIAELHKQDKDLTFGLMTSCDYPISPIKNYGDWAEYQYDLTGGKWRFRGLGGSYPESIAKAGKFSKLTKKACKN